ncbi:MAG: hypothetical protein ACK4GR_02435 [bacterium]
MSSLKNFVLSFIAALILYLIIDLLLTDLPPYSIKLSHTKSYIYLNQNTVEVYSFLYYTPTFIFNTPLKGKRINLSFPLLYEIIDYNYTGFDEFYQIEKSLKGTIDYEKFTTNKNFSIFVKVNVYGNEYVHTYDLPYFWSKDAIVEHFIIFPKKYKLLVINILPSKIEENQENYIVSIQNTRKEKLKISKIFP